MGLASSPRSEPSHGGEPARRHRVVIVDDHELLRTGTRRILEEAADFIVVGEAADGEAARRLIAEVGPDVVLIDIRLPGMNGIDLARSIADDDQAMTILILSAYDDEHYVRAALAAGVAGYLLKTSPSHRLLESIRAACDGFPVIDRTPRDLDRPPATEPLSDATRSSLTNRESEVVRMVARGMSNKAIAHRLGISPRTVEGHLNHVFEKLGTSSRTELVHVALAGGLFISDTVGTEGVERR
ncbi:MAG: response regulator [Acidimicrobiales bacterium]